MKIYPKLILLWGNLAVLQAYPVSLNPSPSSSFTNHTAVGQLNPLTSSVPVASLSTTKREIFNNHSHTHDANNLDNKDQQYDDGVNHTKLYTDLQHITRLQQC